MVASRCVVPAVLLLLFAVDSSFAAEDVERGPDLGLPPLPPVTRDSPLDTMLYADRESWEHMQTRDEHVLEADDGGQVPGDGGLVQVVLNGLKTGTGSPEVFYYGLPAGYDAEGPAHPMVIAYHGFGQSAFNVASVTDIDEEADARGMIFMTVTGIDDQLYGAPIVQQNVSAAIQHMLDNFNVDDDRLYMVGFSMGAGIVTNYAARHRDPDGIMIAAVGTVSGSFDWTMTYNLEPGLQTWLENPFNFGDAPVVVPFAYQRSSVLYFDPLTYPRVPGTLDDHLSMATNLHAVPMYMTWDTGDTIPHLPPQNVELSGLLGAIGTVETNIKSGTVDPCTGMPATHSWYVLTETDLFDFFDGKSVVRKPDPFSAQLDGDTDISFANVQQLAGDAFSWVDCEARESTGQLVVSELENMKEFKVDIGIAGLSTFDPVRATLTSADASETATVRMIRFGSTPSYLLDWKTDELLTGIADSAVLGGAMIVDVAPQTTVDAKVVSEPWTAELELLPDPAPVGSPVLLAIDAEPGAVLAFYIIGFQETLLNVKGGFTIVVPPIAPAVSLQLPLNGEGDFVAGGNIPNDPLLAGARIPMQVVALDAAFKIVSVSNMQAFEIE